MCGINVVGVVGMGVCIMVAVVLSQKKLGVINIPRTILTVNLCTKATAYVHFQPLGAVFIRWALICRVCKTRKKRSWTCKVKMQHCRCYKIVCKQAMECKSI